LLHGFGKAEQPDRIGDGAAVFATTLPDLFVGESDLAAEAVIGESQFDWVEILTLNVLDEGDFEETVRCEILDDGGDGSETGELRGAEAALASDEFVSVVPAADDKGLDDSIFADGLSEFLELGVIEDVARLVRAWFDLVHRNL
jgi:hypothetical protein